MSTLWNKGTSATDIVEKFTVGNDKVLDLRLAKYDVLGSKAHIAMLTTIGLLDQDEETLLSIELDKILTEIEEGKFIIEEGVEDIHSQVELLLTRRVGEVGKKIHSGRSRNDQVLVDLKLYFKDEALHLKEELHNLFVTLLRLSTKFSGVLLPGYTHGQIAMPSSFGMWLGAYAETLVDDMIILAAAYRIIDQNPLGSAAGYGSSFPLDREQTTTLLGFRTLHYNSVAAQMSRGKCEKAFSNALAAIASTLNKLASDCCQYMNGNYGFISFPDELTTGSSIMPHKKNPDVWEIIRAKCNRLQSIPNEISLICTNMPHGYHRDFQLLKDTLFPAIDATHSIIVMTRYMLENMQVNESILDDPRYDYLFTVEEVNKRVLAGVPFRDAYKSVGIEVNNQKFTADIAKEYDSVEKLNHTHIGSLGNLCNDRIAAKMEDVMREF